ncbi:hypothetical protein [Vibrio sp. CAU 1672]|uniref:hypothetical protein n=1 Tax=Vibrio sp. CAU 1672 TaxID=3032594 RepID=UPI0023D9B986|nr:hypothetical protein [Vibrio sp. CAU 1672]MDF2154321.1 hypothetical protein [Vibrio sp. CAU 1672]
MTKYHENDIEYKGETNGIHTWNTPSGQPYYWHPDWLHIAQDSTGNHPKEALEMGNDETPNQKHALKAILKHVNDWASDKFTKNPDIETNAIESEINLKN